MASCAKQITFYGCSNLSGTTCTKTALLTAYVNDTPCTATSAYMLSQAEYNGMGTTAINPDVITAEATIFGVALGALAVAFGLKWVYRLLTGGVGHE